MEKKRKYVICCNVNGEDSERIILATEEQVLAIQWFINTFEIDVSIELVEDYLAEEI